MAGERYKEEFNWKENTLTVFNQGYNDSSWWLKFDVQNTGIKNKYYLEIDYPVLDFVSVHVMKGSELEAHYQLGDKYAFDTRPIDNRLFVIPLDIEPGHTRSIYIRVNSSSSIQVPIKIWEPYAFQKSNITRNVAHGFFIGGMAIIALYNLLIFIALKDRIYFYYVGYVTSMLLFLSSLNGWTFKFLWPNATSWNDTAILVFLNGVVLFGIAFARSLLNIRTLCWGLGLQANIGIAACIVGFPISFWLEYGTSISVLVPFAALACIWMLVVGVYSVYAGRKSASIYLMSWVLLLIGGILMALSKYQVLPKNMITDQALHLGSLLEVVLLSFALAQRINYERSRRMVAQNEALSIQKEANEQLEKNVAIRTLELEEANKKLQDLSDTDQLTGLKNRRYLDRYVQQEIDRSIRYEHDISLLLIDIDHFKSVNDTHGHIVGDVCIQEVANRISAQLRYSTDVSARYGGEEFCVVLPETGMEGSITVANRILESINSRNIQYEAFNQTITVSIGVYTRAPERHSQVKDYYERADKALYVAKNNGRNRVEIQLYQV